MSDEAQAVPASNGVAGVADAAHMADAAGAGSDAQLAIVLVVAVAENGVIGHDGAMPWRQRGDLKRFRALTIGKPVIMGRKTFQSIGRALSGRTNIVLTRQAGWQAPDVQTAATWEDALALATRDAHARGCGDIMVIGGAELYRLALPQAHAVHLTRIHARPDGDTSFPPLDPDVWERQDVSQFEAGPDDTYAWSNHLYVRRSPPRA
ncbi:MAG: dihydrofolate reductase [Pseudomonadota bacterium]